MERHTDERSRQVVLFPDFHGVTEGLWGSCEQTARRAKLDAAVRTAVESSLTGKQREVVEGYFFEGLSQGELARRLGVSQQVIHKRLYGVQRGEKKIGGALEKLRQALAPIVRR